MGGEQVPHVGMPTTACEPAVPGVVLGILGLLGGSFLL